MGHAIVSHAPIGLFYGSSTCYTEIASEKIRSALGCHYVDSFNINETPIITAEFYDCIIFGIPTWDYGELQEDWEDIWDDIDSISWKGKKIAIFGLGDQIGYPEWFLDAMGYLHAKLIAHGAIACGYWPSAGYTFEASKALTPDASQFVGLALDEENEFDKTANRISTWCQQLRLEFSL